MPFFPTHIEQVKLRKFHRPPFNTNEIPTGIQIQINSCSKACFQMMLNEVHFRTLKNNVI